MGFGRYMPSRGGFHGGETEVSCRWCPASVPVKTGLCLRVGGVLITF